VTAAGVVTVLTAGSWGGLGALVLVAAVRTARSDVRRRLPDCCPHPEADAPATVRGEFRAVVTR
jgi:hypothetical protein